MFGYANYCSNGHKKEAFDKLTGESNGEIECENAEIAVWEKDGFDKPWITRQCWLEAFEETLYDDVVGHITSETLAKVIAWAMGRKHLSERRIIND